MIAGALDEGRIGGFERQHAMLCQIYGVLESAAKDGNLELTWGLADPDARPDVHWSPAEARRRALETAKRQLSVLPGKAKSRGRAEALFEDDGNIQNHVGAAVKEALHAKPQGPANQGAYTKGRRGKLRLPAELRSLILVQLSLAVVPGGCTLAHLSGWAVIFARIFAFSRKTEFSKCVSEEIAITRMFPSQLRAASDLPRSASPRCRVHCNHREARARIVALISCCVARLSDGGLGPLGEHISLPACTRRSICRGAALASRLDPLGFQRG